MLYYYGQFVVEIPGIFQLLPFGLISFCFFNKLSFSSLHWRRVSSWFDGRRQYCGVHSRYFFNKRSWYSSYFLQIERNSKDSWWKWDHGCSKYNELETLVIDVLKAKFDFPIYLVGPVIPYFELKSKTSSASNHQDFVYIKWLDMQPARKWKLSDKRKKLRSLGWNLWISIAVRGKGWVKRALWVQEICQGAVAEGGSFDTNLNAFIQDISQAS